MKQMHKDSIQEILKEKREELISIEGIEGFGQGVSEGTPCIIIYASVTKDKLSSSIPKEIKGYNVIIRETGTFTAEMQRAFQYYVYSSSTLPSLISAGICNHVLSIKQVKTNFFHNSQLYSRIYITFSHLRTLLGPCVFRGVFHFLSNGSRGLSPYSFYSKPPDYKLG